MVSPRSSLIGEPARHLHLALHPRFRMESARRERRHAARTPPLHLELSQCGTVGSGKTAASGGCSTAQHIPVQYGRGSHTAEPLTACTRCRYYYAEKGTQGNGGGFLNGALEDGFLQVEQSDLTFSLMWANQDWVDVHPAKRGWSSTGRAPPAANPVIQPNEPHHGVTPDQAANTLLLRTSSVALWWRWWSCWGERGDGASNGVVASHTLTPR